MCGRYTLTSFDNLALEFGLGEPPPPPVSAAPRYNIAPTQDAPIIRNTAPRILTPARWGLVPFWAKDERIGSRMINARCETAAEKPAFRDALRQRRCIVIADGFFEWKPVANNPGPGSDGGARTGTGSSRRALKTPHYIHRRSGAPFAMAGLWERWRKADGDWLDSFAILTCDANALMAPLHHRMPVILDRADYDRWLLPESLPSEAVADLLVPAPVGDFEAYAVSRVVNAPKNDVAACIEPAPPPGSNDATDATDAANAAGAANPRAAGTASVAAGDASVGAAAGGNRRRRGRAKPKLKPEPEPEPRQTSLFDLLPPSKS